MLNRIRFLLQRTLHRGKLDEDIHNEIESYYEEVEHRLFQEGHTSDQAFRIARVRLGHPENIKQRVRNEQFGDWPELLLKDIRYSARSLMKSPLFFLVAAGSLAIGIGANSAMFSFADWWILRPLPVRSPAQIVVIRPRTSGTGGGPASLSYPDYTDIRDTSHSFDGVIAAAYRPLGVSLDGDGMTQPERRLGAYVSGNFFSVLGVEPALGRFFTRQEDFPGNPLEVAVLSYDFWSAAFHRGNVLGRSLRIDGASFTIVGVAPRSFAEFDPFVRPSFYLPIASAGISEPVGIWRDRGNRWLTVRARLRSGVALTAAQKDVSRIAATLRQEHPEDDSALQLRTESELQFKTEFSPPTTAFIVMLTMLALCVLLVACANVGGLLLSRSAVRSRQAAMKLAVGVTRLAIFRQLIIENLIIALSGGLAGLGIATAGIHLLRSLPPPSASTAYSMDIHLDLRALLFTAAISLASTLAFGLGPALAMTRVDLLTAMKPHIAGRDTRPDRLRLRSALIVAQVALSVTLLVASTVLIGGFRAELLKGPGFRTNGLFLEGFDPTLLRYSDAETAAFYDKLLQRISVTPGIEKAALASTVPLAFGATQMGIDPGGDPSRRDRTPPQVIGDIVSDDYFDVMAIPLLRGRPFSDFDTARSPRVAIINEHLAQHYWPGENVLGKSLRLDDPQKTVVRIVGVAATSKYVFIAEPELDALYLPWRQRPVSQMILISRTVRNPQSIEPVIRRVVSTIDPKMPIFEERTIRSLYIGRAIKTPQVITRATTAFGVMGLILSLMGLYGLVSYQVVQRTREIGVRMALGANAREVVAWIAGRALRLVVAGSIAGLLLGALTSKAIRWGLFVDLGHVALLPFAWMLGAVIVTAAIAATVPASRAAHVDPILALRDE